MADKISAWSAGNIQLLKRCISYFMPYKWYVIFGSCSMLVVAPMDAAVAWLVKFITDDVLIAKELGNLKLAAIGILALLVIKSVCRFFQVYMMRTAGLKVLRDLRDDLFDRAIRLPVKFFADSQVGMLMSRILSDVSLIRQSLPSIIMLARSVLQGGALIGYVVYTNPRMAFWALIVLPAAVYPFLYFSKRLRQLGRKAQVKSADINSLLNESFHGVRVIKAFADEKREIERFRKQNSWLTWVFAKSVLSSELSSRIMELVGGLAVLLVLWFGGKSVIEGGMTPGELISFIAAVGMLYEPIKKIEASNQSIQSALVGAERVFELIDSPDIVSETSGDVVLEGKRASLQLENVRFGYLDDDRYAVDGVSLDIQPGQRVALVGPSGSGKTTLANLIPRFYDVQEGVIRINGVPVQDYTLESLRLNIGMVAQDTFLFNRSVTENIAYGPLAASREKVEDAARAAFAHDFILELSDGYETVLGERGVKLSGGQKQRLTIARALLKNPALLILDEATSALDTESERIVQSALDNLMKNRTSIIIAHRLSTVLTADKIVVMEKGRIVDQGTHQELLERCPLFQKLYELQFDTESITVACS